MTVGWPSVRRAALLGLAGAVLFTACPKRPPVSPVRLELPDEAALRGALERSIPLAGEGKTREDALVSPFKLKLTQAGRTDRLDGALALSWPPGGPLQVRLELFGPLGPPLAYAVVRPDQALLYLPYGGNRALSTSEPRALLARGGLGLELLLELLLGGGLPCTGVGQARPLVDALTEQTDAGPSSAQPPLGLAAACVTAPGTPALPLTLLFAGSPLTLWGLEQETADHRKTRIQLMLARGGTEPRARVSGFLIAAESAEPGAPLLLELRLDEAERSTVLPADPALFHLDVPEGAAGGRLEDWLLELTRGGR